jgi:hypothetical protein
MKKERTFVIDGEKITAEVERDGDDLRITLDGETHTVRIDGDIGPSKPVRSRRGRLGAHNEILEASSLRYPVKWSQSMLK